MQILLVRVVPGGQHYPTYGTMQCSTFFEDVTIPDMSPRSN